MNKLLNCDCKLCIYCITCTIVEDIKREMVTYNDRGFVFACEIIYSLERAVDCKGEPVKHF